LQLLANMSDELQKGDAKLVDIALAKSIDPFEKFCQNYDLFDRVYNNVQQLEEMNVKLLYLQPPNNYLRTFYLLERQLNQFQKKNGRTKKQDSKN
jgi:hypothetical protein